MTWRAEWALDWSATARLSGTEGRLLDAVSAAGRPMSRLLVGLDESQVAVPLPGGDPQPTRDDDHDAASASTSGTGTCSAANRPAAAAARKYARSSG